MDIQAFLAFLQNAPWYSDQIVHMEDISGRASTPGVLRDPLHPDLQASLESFHIKSLYSHQAEAINSSKRGKNVIVTTPAASGKSFCYHLPVLDSLLKDRSNRALYIFPTKALAQDQSKMLSTLTYHGGKTGVRHGIFDGDTPPKERSDVRRYARIVITNPDMLHFGILPNHRSWYTFLKGLRYIVIDEAHVYRGVFGSHVANIIRRLVRLCRRFGSNPQFIVCSATIANPGEHAEKLTGRPFQTVDENGASYGGKDFLFWNPPVVDFAKGRRRSTNNETANIFHELLVRRVPTLAFAHTRRLTELIYVYVRDKLKLSDPTMANRLSPYRGSYLPEDRRRIEADLLEGRLIGVVTTNALELGIDIGDIDATLINGYPGSIASTWQQAGRSGRRGDRSLSVLVAQENPLDQYFMRHPDVFFGKSYESVRISPNNPHILKPHLLCAAFEAPLSMDDTAIFGPDLLWYADELTKEGVLRVRSDLWHIQPDAGYPAEEVNIRSTSADLYTLVEKDSGVILEMVDEVSAFMQLHPGAVYLHQGEQFLIKELDLDLQIAYSVRTHVPYYTEIRDSTEMKVLNKLKEKTAGRTTVYLGEVNVSTRVLGYKRKRHFSEEVVSEENLDLPAQNYNTVAIWFGLPEDTLSYMRTRRFDLAGGLHAIEHAAIGVLPLFALCDRNDIGGISTPLHPDTGLPQVFIHDGHPGGVGIAERGYEMIEELWYTALQVISECPCEVGCPGCIHSPKCGSNNQPLDKEIARLMLIEILGAANQ